MEIDLKQLLLILWRRMLVICICAVAGGVLAWVITAVCITPKYSATTSMYVYNTNNRNTEGITQGDLTASQKLVDTYIVILKSNAVLKGIAEKTKLGYSVDDMRKMISASAVNRTEVFEIVVTSSNRQHAQLIANTIAEVVPQEIIRVVKAGSVEVIDKAKLPIIPSSPNLTLNIVVGVLLGIILSIVTVILIELFDTTIKTEQDLIDVFNIPIIGKIPSLEQSIR